MLKTDDRGSDRYRLLLEARASEEEHGAIPVLIHDVSRTGLLFETEVVVASDAEIILNIPGLGFTVARIVWSSGSFFGAEFGATLSESALAGVYARSKVVWPEFNPSPEIVRGPPLLSLPGIESSPQILSDRVQEPGLPVARRVQIVVALSFSLWAAIVFGVLFAF
jgi:hypothetical protein